MRKLLFLLGLFVFASFPAVAQDWSRGEIFGGYTYTRTDNSNGDHASSNGGDADVAYYPTKMFGVVGDFGAATSGGFTTPTLVHVKSSSDTIHYLAGPRVRFTVSHITPFFDVLVGGVHRSDLTSNGTTLVAAETSFDLTTGGGVDLSVSKHLSFRAIKISYVYTRFSPPGGNNTQNGVSYTTGGVFNW